MAIQDESGSDLLDEAGNPILAEDEGTSFTGTVDGTQAAQTQAATGLLTFAATATATQAVQTQSASGALTFAATASGTQASQTVAAAGELLFTGTIAGTQAPVTQDAAGSLTFSGEAAGTQAAQTQTAEGQTDEAFAGPFEGTISGTQAAQESSGAGLVPVQPGGGVIVLGGLGGRGWPAQQRDVPAPKAKLALRAIFGRGESVAAAQTNTATGTVMSPAELWEAEIEEEDEMLLAGVL